MRVGIAQLWQETNTFNPIQTTRADFEAFGILRGEQLIEQLADTNEPGGFIQSLAAWPERPTPVGLVRLPAWPSGVATADTFAWIRDEILAAFDRAGPLDALLFALHGAMVAEGAPDVEGEILSTVRARLGSQTPIVATLDLHANITRRMVDTADALVLYHTAPHVDVFETGQRAAAVMRRILIDGARQVTAFRKLPLVLPAERANTQDPTSPSFALRERLVEIEKQPDILTAGLATVQPWLDIPEFGSAVVVVTDGNQQLADERCGELADRLWQRRREYLPELIDAPEAVARAHRLCDAGLVVISDSADATTSGAPGDSTHLLAELLKYDWPRPVLVPLVDPELVAQLGEKTPATGTQLDLMLGGKRDTRFGRSLKVPVTFERHFQGRFVMSGHLGRNLAIDMGPGVVLRANQIHVIVTSRSGPHFAPEMFRSAGFDPFAAAVLIAKSPCGFRAVYQERAVAIFVARAPGCAPSDFWNYEYRNIPRGIWPFDRPGEGHAE